jgi:hypothetical protein
MTEKPMCLSREEQDSIRALAGEAEETVELTQSIYNAVMSRRDSSDPDIVPVFAELDSPTRRALQAPPLPTYDTSPPKD